jgi:hypothetical protein
MTDRDRIKQMAMEAGFPSMCVENMSLLDIARLTAFAALVAEDCTKVCMQQQSDLRTRQKYSQAIRARYPLHSEAEPG